MARSCTRYLQEITPLVQQLSGLERQVTAQHGMETAAQKHEINTLTGQINALLLAYELCSKPVPTEHQPPAQKQIKPQPPLNTPQA